MLARELQRGETVRRDRRLMPGVPHDPERQFEIVRLVFDDEDLRHGLLSGQACWDASGRSSVNVEPSPSPPLLAETEPPWASTTRRATYSPSPTPILSFVAGVSIRPYLRKITARCDRASPTP